MSEDAHQTVDEVPVQYDIWSRLDAAKKYVITVDLLQLTPAEKLKFIQLWSKVRVTVDQRP